MIEWILSGVLAGLGLLITGSIPAALALFVLYMIYYRSAEHLVRRGVI